MDAWDTLELIADGFPEGPRKRAIEGVMVDVLRLQKVAQKAHLLAVATLDSHNVMDIQWAKDIVALTTKLPDREERR